jgi:asparagine synthase (glutamine-hydrolysing)
VSEQHYLQHLTELSVCRDAPVSEPADVAVAEMSRIAKQTVKVVLSGEGSDEVFCGYPKYRFATASRLIRDPIRFIGPHRAAWLAGRLGMDTRRSLVAARALALPKELDRLVQWFSYLDRSNLRRLLPGLRWSDEDWDCTMAAQNAALTEANATHAAERMQLVDCLTWLPGNMLERGDRMTMAAGLEARVPFLDRELVAFGLALPSHLKIRGKTLKWIVRQWASKSLPSGIAGRKKWGFRVPLAQWFRGNMRDKLHDYLLSNDGLCGTYGNRQTIELLLESHQCGRIDANLDLWTLLSTEIWYRDVFCARGRKATKHLAAVG